MAVSNRNTHGIRTTRLLLGAASLLCLSSAALADTPPGSWPITFVKKLPAADVNFSGISSSEPVHDCQPESFDPKVNTAHPLPPAKPAQPASGAAAASAPAAPPAPSVTVYHVDGAEQGTTMTIDGRIKPGDAKIELEDPLSASRYFFTCATGSSEAIVLSKGSKRYAIFQHITQSAFSPDREKLVFFNVGKLRRSGGWQRMRAVFVIKGRHFAPLPVINATSFLGTVDNQHFLTYGLGSGANSPGTAVVWNMNGNAVKALSIPLHPAQNGKGTADILGLLPGESSTFYQLTRSDKDVCILRLQDLRNPKAHRALVLTVPGVITNDADLHSLVQLDLSGLTLNGGTAKFRVADGKGGWSAWQTAQ